MAGGINPRFIFTVERNRAMRGEGVRGNCSVSVEQWGIPSKGWDLVLALWVRVTIERETVEQMSREGEFKCNPRESRGTIVQEPGI